MKRTNIFFRCMCLVMLLGSFGVCWGQTAWTKLTDAGGSLGNGNYQIQDNNLSVRSSIIIANGKVVTIDLNGYVLSGGTGVSCVIEVQSGGTLTIKDTKDTSHLGSLNANANYILDWPVTGGNKSFYGGTIYNDYVDKDTDRRGIMVSGTCTLEDGVNIMGCFSKTNGAAVYVNTGGSFTMTGGEISYNCALNNGGGIYSRGSLSINKSKIQYNKAMGAVNTATSRISGGQGGGIFAHEGSCIVKECDIANNYASVFGGGIYSAVGTTITDSFIRYNRAMYTEKNAENRWNVGRGGGFCFVGSNAADATPNECTLENTEVSHNACFYYGGGGHIANTNVTLTMINSELNDNEAVLHGAGGLHVTAGASFEFESGEISGNVAHSVGGGIHSSYDCKLSLTGGTISANTAHHRGGGVHVNTGGVLKLEGTNITDNEVLNGPAYEFSTVTFNADGSISWSEPTSSTPDTPYPDAGYGGGVLIDAGTCTMEKGLLSGNKAKVGGGGLALVMINTDVSNKTNLMSLKVVQFTLNDGTILNNTTEGDGAGVYLMRNKMNEVDSKPDENTINLDAETKAKWNELSNGIPQASIYGGTLSGNVAGKNGGALLVNGNVTMNDGTFSKNIASNGGGICIIGGNVNVTKGNIIKNEATNYGGGIYVENEDSKATVTLSGNGVFRENQANAGGGLAVKGPFTFNFAGIIENNSAVNGGGIYLLKGTEAVKGATLNFNGGYIRSNTAECTETLAGNTAIGKDVVKTGDVEAAVGVGGGVFMADYTTLKFDVSNELGFYGNRATNAADDIFANGNGTSITLPDVSKMTLSDYDVPVPVGSLFWAEDYYSYYNGTGYVADASYSAGTNQLVLKDNLVPKQNLRYYYALEQLKSHDHIAKIDVSKFNQEFTGKYVCLTLGYYIYYVTIKKMGLQEGESAMFDIYSKNTGDEPYITMLLSNNPKAKKDGEWIIKKVALPEGYWKVNEKTDWSWAYNLVSESTTPDKSNEGYVEVKGEGVEFSFNNEKQQTEYMHDEDIEVNKMRYIKVSSGNNE